MHEVPPGDETVATLVRRRPLARSKQDMCLQRNRGCARFSPTRSRQDRRVAARKRAPFNERRATDSFARIPHHSLLTPKNQQKNDKNRANARREQKQAPSGSERDSVNVRACRFSKLKELGSRTVAEDNGPQAWERPRPGRVSFFDRDLHLVRVSGLTRITARAVASVREEMPPIGPHARPAKGDQPATAVSEFARVGHVADGTHPREPLSFQPSARPPGPGTWFARKAVNL